jgi:hypothetical protein
MDATDPVELNVRAVYDSESEAVGLDVTPSAAFSQASDTQAVVEILAAVAAKVNFMAAEAIGAWADDPDRQQKAFDHFATLKENMLQDMLDRTAGQ